MKKFAVVLLAVTAATACIIPLACDSGTPNPARVESISLSEERHALDAESEFTLTVSQFPTEADPCQIEWSTSDPEVAVVEDGKVTARARGRAVVTARARTGNLSAACEVTVSDTATFRTVYPGESINEAIQSFPSDNASFVTVKLMSGTYVEDVTVNRPYVRLLGANAGLGNIQLTRGPESVILPATVRLPASNLSDDRQNLGVVTLDADHVVIDGVAICGDNPELQGNLDSVYGGRYQAGKTTDSYTGIVTRVKKLSYSTGLPVMLRDIAVENCLITDVFYAGVSLSARNSLSSSVGNRICNNRIQNVYSTDYGFGIDLDKNIYAEISGNSMENVQTGVFCNVLNLDGTEACISDNTISARANGVVIAKVSANAGYDVKDNSIRSDSGNFGIAYLTCTKDTNRNMFASGNRIEGFACGIQVYNSNRSISVLGGEIVDCGQGLYVTDTSTAYLDGVAMTLVDVLNVNCEQTSFEDCETAVHVLSDKRRNNSLILKGGNIRNCDTGLKAEVASGASAIINVVSDPTYENVGAAEVALGAGQINRS